MQIYNLIQIYIVIWTWNSQIHFTIISGNWICLLYSTLSVNLCLGLLVLLSTCLTTSLPLKFFYLDQKKKKKKIDINVIFKSKCFFFFFFFKPEKHKIWFWLISTVYLTHNPFCDFNFSHLPLISFSLVSNYSRYIFSRRQVCKKS